MSGGIFIKVNENMHHFYKGIGIGRFRILGGGQDLEYWGGGAKRVAKFPAGTWRRNDVDASCAH